tara:strand:- start:487 stop:837 length:351 start_codon:yes stop_codon:yes gene_type:complete
MKSNTTETKTSQERPKWVSPSKLNNNKYGNKYGNKYDNKYGNKYDNKYGNKYNPLSRRRKILKRLEEEDRLEAIQKLQRAFKSSNSALVNKTLSQLKQQVDAEKMKEFKEILGQHI